MMKIKLIRSSLLLILRMRSFSFWEYIREREKDYALSVEQEKVVQQKWKVKQVKLPKSAKKRINY